MARVAYDHERSPMLSVDTNVKFGNKVQSIKKLIPAHQHKGIGSFPIFQTYVFNDAPINLFRNNGSKYRTQLSRSSIHKINQLTLKIVVTVNTSPTGLAPLPYWFDRIDIKTSDGSNIKTYYNDTIMFNLLSHLKKAQTKSILSTINLDYNDNSYLGGTPQLLPFAQYTFYLPLNASCFSSHSFYMKNNTSDIILEFSPSSSIISSGSGTIDLNSMSLIVESVKLSDDDHNHHEKLSNHIVSSQYLNIVPVQRFGVTLTNNSQYLLDLINLNGKCAFLLLIVRKQGANNTNNGNLEYVNLGDSVNGTIDLLDSSNQSILGSGVQINLDYLKHHIHNYHFDNDFNYSKSYYLIPFTNNILQSFAGVQNGFYEFDGSSYKLAFTPKSAVTEVWTITTSAAINSGSYRFQIGPFGECSDEILHNATAATIKTTIERMAYIRSKNITVTASAALANNITLAFASVESDGVGNHIKIISENLVDAGNASVIVSSAKTTQGIAGITSGSQYDISCYAYMYHDLSYYKGRFISSIV